MPTMLTLPAGKNKLNSLICVKDAHRQPNHKSLVLACSRAATGLCGGDDSRKNMLRSFPEKGAGRMRGVEFERLTPRLFSTHEDHSGMMPRRRISTSSSCLTIAST